MAYLNELPKPERDTACFSSRQWFVGERAFTTKEDAEQAVKLAEAYATSVARQQLQRVGDFIDQIE